MRISQVADHAGIAPSTVRYYERIGLVPRPGRTPSGYRDYDEDAAARLLFVTRAKRIGLTLEQIAALLPFWDGVHCATTHDADHTTGRDQTRRGTRAHQRAAALRFSTRRDRGRATRHSPAVCLPPGPFVLRPNRRKHAAERVHRNAHPTRRGR